MEIKQRLENIERRLTKLEEKMRSFVSSPSTQIKEVLSRDIKKESPREFLLKFSAKTDTEKTLVAIHYLEKKGAQIITINEIKSTLNEMREKVPKNISDKIQLLDKRGFLKLRGKEGKRKNWIVSNSGEEFLEEIKNG